MAPIATGGLHGVRVIDRRLAGSQVVVSRAAISRLGTVVSMYRGPMPLASLLTLVACTSSTPSRGAPDSGTVLQPDGQRNGSNVVADARTMSDSGAAAGAPITCPGPGMPKSNGGSCGTERWNIKTGTDAQAPQISLVPQSDTIAALAALAPAGGGTTRESPTETTLWELDNVTLTELKEESDSDYHLVISDGTHTMIAEIPYPSCATNSAWSCFISRSRSEIDAKYTVTNSPQYPAATVTLRGIGFFDFLHSQTGVAPNAIELHPVLQICFGANCTPT